MRPPEAFGRSVRRVERKEHSTTPDGESEKQFLEVTHPFHPLYGRQFELLDHRQTWGEDRVYFQDETGRLRRLPASWTSVAAKDPFVVIAAGRAHFRPQDLLQLARMVALQVGEAARRCQGNDAVNVK